MALYYITDSNWNHFLQFLLNQYITFSLHDIDGKLFWRRTGDASTGPITVSRYRALHSIKSFFFPLSEEVTTEPSERKTVLVGAKACDLRHLEIMDAMFSGGVVEDPYYAARRRNTLIIACDCDAYLPSCFCTNMGGQPHAAKGYDLNLTPVRSGYVVETGSAAGEALIAGKRRLFQDPQKFHQEERAGLREKMIHAVEESNRRFTWSSMHDLVKAGYESHHWKDDIAATCVECDACRFNCGTCYCFLLGDAARQWEKIRSWDSCQSHGYGRVAGGANPRKTRHERLRNFYTCKLVYRPDNFGLYACSGCGRCIEVCQGRIDIRESLQKLHEHV